MKNINYALTKKLKKKLKRKLLRKSILEIKQSIHKTSLLSKILINSAINRCILEIDELANLQCDSYELMFDILLSLEKTVTKINIESDIFSEIKNILLKNNLIKEDSNLDIKKLELLTEKCLLDLCALHSKSNPESYEDRKKIHLTPHGKFLMALTISILKCKNFKINLKAFDINHTKDYEIINKNTKTKDKFHLPIQILINRIYNCLFYSDQHIKFSTKEFSRYNYAMIEKRKYIRKLFIAMKKLSLDDFSKLLKPVLFNKV
ncbi:hypothetical protein [Acinetobacter wuhouensis]|uniref:Uncharacterized protein n=1 Tax=Acinetobacter wuhouensis TaxID=1879050 RepID=A0A3G2T0L7_9GAMM|nr:hypothetical protein [Acinetobacter wuhouensis]AYO53396.1 hypothetical protein CDG68_06925 [Acinetobacter wuhouensis]